MGWRDLLISQEVVSHDAVGDRVSGCSDGSRNGGLEVHDCL